MSGPAESGVSASRGNASCPLVYCRSANARNPPTRDVPRTHAERL